ncbi:MAG: helix-hairpin-helix domain-containing protein [Chloroherpetonaceae bacterium]|nr:helix-hairpin-helix domain-containing protein [Chloroherpetonaceae bacterium]MDW8437281.1 helix-hairpin-helix domain-containing protein [Chloroherpetonaceae bacterium]
MFKLVAFFLCFVSLGASAFAGGEKLDVGARAIALGGAFTGLANSSATLFYNPAGAMLIPYREASFFHARPYGLKELDYLTFSYVEPSLLPRQYGAFGVLAKRYGFELYNEIMFGIAYANSFEKKFLYGVGLNYQRAFIKNYGSAGAIGVSVGALGLISESLLIGVAAHNLNAPTMGVSREELAQTYAVGLSYKALSNLLLVVDAEKDVRFPLNLKGGIEYRPVSSVSFRVGFSSEPSRFSGGVGAHYALLDLDYAFSTHRDLGLTHHLSVSLRFGSGSTPEAAARALAETIELAFADDSRPLKEGETLELNRATAAELMRVPKMTRQLAERILRYRAEVGKFSDVSELRQIKGIDEEKFRHFSKFFRVEEK